MLVCCVGVAYLFANLTIYTAIGSRFSRMSEKQCYVRNQIATDDAPYTVHEYIELTKQPDGTFTGIKRGNQSGPDMTNGYEGTLTSTSVYWRQVQLMFDYTIEGSQNRELEIYEFARARGGRYAMSYEIGINKLRYPLIDQGGILVPDTTQKYTLQRYASVICDKAIK